MNKRITFSEDNKQFILKSFNKKIDDEGFIVEKDNPKQRVLAPDGTEINLEKFAGIRNGSEIFIKSDLPSLIEMFDDLSSQ